MCKAFGSSYSQKRSMKHPRSSKETYMTLSPPRGRRKGPHEASGRRKASYFHLRHRRGFRLSPWAYKSFQPISWAYEVPSHHIGRMKHLSTLSWAYEGRSKNVGGVWKLSSSWWGVWREPWGTMDVWRVLWSTKGVWRINKEVWSFKHHYKGV